MRDLSEFDTIYTDLDNTLIYGFMTDLMDITWKLFKSQPIATILATIQAKFRLYKVNKKLLYAIKTSERPVVVMTARKPMSATKELFEQLNISDSVLVEMASMMPYIDKIDYILDDIECEDKVILFDDNMLTRIEAMSNDILAVDPTSMFERKIP